MNNTLASKRALVTGSGTGIGREIAIEFARAGADVALHYSHNSDGANSAAEEIRKLGRRAEAFKAGFNNLSLISDFRARSNAKFGNGYVPGA